MEVQAKHVEGLESRLPKLEEPGSEAETPESTVGDRDSSSSKPPKRAYGLPDASVVTLQPQPDEAHAFGPAAELVTEWRLFRTGDTDAGGWIERARAEERRWELEVAMIRDFGLTLPPETEPLNESRRDDHLGWRRKTLRQARGRRVRAEWLRRVMTLGLGQK